MYNRRRIITMLGASALVLPAALKVREAGAAVTWCRSDPVFLVDNKLVDVRVASALAMLQQASGPVQLVLTVPEGSMARTLYQDGGFGYGYDISFATSPTFVRSSQDPQVHAAVFAPAAGVPLPVRVSYTARMKPITVDGWSNSWITAE